MLLHKALILPVFFGLIASALGQLSLVCSLPKSPQSRASNVHLAPLTDPEMKIAYGSIAEGAKKFGLEFFKEISDSLEFHNNQMNFMVSPFSVWSLLLLLLEAATRNTERELRSTLHINDDLIMLRAAFSEVQQFLVQHKSATVDVRSLQAMFVDKYEKFSEVYKRTIEECYGGRVYQLDFDNATSIKKFVNDKIASVTQGLIQDAVNGELEDVRMLLTSTLYFKGQWKYPFNKSETHQEAFYNDYGVQIGNVDMMFQMTPFNYTSMNELEGHVLELPYGTEDRLCMLLILPRKGITLNRLVHNLERVGVSAIIKKIATDSQGYDDEEVEVYLPRFTTSTTFNLRGILEKMGIKDLFDPAKVELSNLSKNLFVKDILHNTRIIVNEEGTEAAAVTTSVLANKASPPKFYFNRPFLYLIAERRTNLLLFAGQIVNPNFS